MKLFHFLAKKISYTFAISFYTVMVGLIAAVFGAFLGSSFVIFSYEKYLIYVSTWLPISALIAALMHYIQFGFFSPIKVPALLKSHRRVNYYYMNQDIDDSELEIHYRYFSDITMHNTLSAVIYTIVTIIILIGIGFYNYKVTGIITVLELKILYKIVILAAIIIIIIYGMSTYLLTESLTNKERTDIYNKLLRKGIRIKPSSLVSVRFKLNFFIILSIMTLLTFAALMEKIKYSEEYNVSIIIIYFFISIVIGLFLMLINSNSIVKVLGDIKRVTREIASGGRTGFDILSLDREFVQIEYALMEMAWEIDEFRKNLEFKVDQRTNELQTALSDLRGRDEQIQKQLDMASVIQRSILPGKIDDWNELKFSVRYIAMEKIGGDFYDVHQLKDDKLGIMVADVSGHGIPAALVTTMAKISFGNAGSLYDSPRRIFQEVNQNILDHVKTQDYMTCFMVSIDDEYNVVYSNASHQKAILLRTEKGETELLDTNGLFLGAIEDARDTYDEKNTKLNYGDRLILYTDGITEALNDERVEYSVTRLEETIKNGKNLPIEEFSDYIIEEVEKYIGNAQVEDDLTLLVIELVRDEAVDIVKQSKKMTSSHMYYEAIEILEKSIEKFKDNQKILYNLAKNYFRVNNYNKSIQIIEKYLENDKLNKFAFYIGGAAHYQLMDYNSAIDYFEKSLNIDSNFVNSMFALGMSFKKKKEIELAIRTFERLINIDSDNKMALFELNELRSEQKKDSPEEN